MWQALKKLFKRKPVFKQARVYDREFVTVEYLGWESKELNLHRVRHQGNIFVLHGGQIK